jgi:membrane-associated phospholipid phosphatase
MKQKILCNSLGIVIALMLLTSPSFAQSTEGIERTGDVLQIAIPLTAYGMTYLFDDAEGRRSFSNVFFSTMGTTYALKYSFPEERPDGGNLSFISGHTSAAFSGATFIQRRYGWKYGIPAYLGAAFVGWSRVESGRHHTDDVLRGAALGILSAYVFTKPYKGTIRIVPLVNDLTVSVAFQGSW